jgi:hypothetical protein
MKGISMKKGFYALFLAAMMALTACAKAPDSKATTDALRDAIGAEVPDRNLAGLRLGRSFATNFDKGRQLVVARKVGNVPGRLDCAQFDITVSRPSSLFSLFGKGDSDWDHNVKVCVP